MGFREPLDLSDITRHYQRWLGGASTVGTNYVFNQPDYAGEQPEMEPIPAEVYERKRVSEEPFRIGYKKSPDHFSTCTAVSVLTHLCWDVNGYYQTLGVHWRASRKELMEAYRDSGGPDDVYKTYVLKQLLNKSVRLAYDMSPLGEPFLDDIYVQEELKRKASREAGLRTLNGDLTTAQQVLDEQGYHLQSGPPDTASDGQNPSAAGDLSDPSATFEEWLWAYYVWRSSGTDTARLRSWQQLLTAAAGDRGAVLRIGLGFVGKTPHDFMLGEQQGLTIFYLNDKVEPSSDIATRAINQHLRDTHTQ